MADPVVTNMKTLEDLKPVIQQIKDGHLQLVLYAALAVGDIKGAQHYIDKVRANGQPDVAQKITDFISTHRFDPTSKTWGTLPDIYHNATGLGNSVNNAVTGGIFDISTLVSALVNKNTWLRIGEGLMGILLLGIGVSIIAKSTSVGQSVIKAGKTGAKVVPK